MDLGLQWASMEGPVRFFYAKGNGQSVFMAAVFLGGSVLVREGEFRYNFFLYPL